MPTISQFYGLLVRMFFDDARRHHLPHIHVAYQDDEAVYSIQDGKVLEGELMADWKLAMAGRALFKIRGLE